MPLSPDTMQAIAWGVTLGIEVVGAALLWAAHLIQRQLPRILWVVCGVNLLTHPIFWLVLRRLPHPGPNVVLAGEVAVMGVEAALYGWLLALPPARALGLSLGLNLLSWLGGILVWQRILAP